MKPILVEFWQTTQFRDLGVWFQEGLLERLLVREMLTIIDGATDIFILFPEAEV